MEGGSACRMVRHYGTLDQTESLTKPHHLKASTHSKHICNCLRVSIFCFICSLFSFFTRVVPQLKGNPTVLLRDRHTLNMSTPLALSRSTKSLHWCNFNNMLISLTRFSSLLFSFSPSSLVILHCALPRFFKLTDIHVHVNMHKLLVYLT